MSSHKKPEIQIFHTIDAEKDIADMVKSDITNAVKRWKSKRNENNFNKTYKSSADNQPRMKMYECVKDETIKGILFSLEPEKISINISSLIFAPINPIGIPAGKSYSMPSPTSGYEYQYDSVSLYYYSWSSGNIGIKNNKSYQHITIPINECVIGTGRKLISGVKDADVEELYEALTTKGTGFIKRSNLRPSIKNI